MWEIIDKHGTIYSGEEENIRTIFEQIETGKIYETWDGDLKLVEVHATLR
jgi:hypothetical protein